MCPPFHLVYFIEVDFKSFAARGKAGEGPGAIIEEDGVGECILQYIYIRSGEKKQIKNTHTSIIGVWPLTDTLSDWRLISTIRSLALRFPGVSMVMSRSEIVCVHL